MPSHCLNLWCLLVNPTTKNEIISKLTNLPKQNGYCICNFPALCPKGEKSWGSNGFLIVEIQYMDSYISCGSLKPLQQFEFMDCNSLSPWKNSERWHHYVNQCWLLNWTLEDKFWKFNQDTKNCLPWKYISKYLHSAHCHFVWASLC